MIRTSVFLTFCALCSSDWLNNLIGVEDVSDNSVEYNGYEQAPYTVLQTINESVEVRRYPSLYWACTEGTIDYQADAANDGVLGIFNYFTRDRSNDENGRLFWRLFRYIQGENENSQKIDMTVPVTTRMKMTKEGKLNKLMCFYIQTDPPQPTDTLVKIIQTEELIAIVKRFGGYIMENSLWMRKADQFKKELIARGIKGYNLQEFMTAGYDSPMTFWNRRNEILFKKLI